MNKILKLRSVKMAEEEILFSKQMRKATREIHAVSDALVNAKLAFALSDNSVWAEGLLIFYEIFRYLEDAMVRLKDNPIFDFNNIEGLKRTEAFKQDLDFYLGSDWTKDYNPRESVIKYLLHLMQLEKDNPILLMAYIYHLYMGLLSGGQILNRKRSIVKNLVPFSNDKTGGEAVTNFGDRSIASIKRQIVTLTNEIAANLDDETKHHLLEESKQVFILNNIMIKTVQGTTKVLLKKCVLVFIFIFIIVLLYVAIF